MRDALRKIGYGALMLLGLAINLPILAAFGYGAYVTITELGWWWALLTHGGILVFAVVAIWQWTGEPLLEWWERRYIDRRYGALAEASLATQPRRVDLARAHVPPRGRSPRSSKPSAPSATPFVASPSMSPPA